MQALQHIYKPAFEISIMARKAARKAVRRTARKATRRTASKARRATRRTARRTARPRRAARRVAAVARVERRPSLFEDTSFRGAIQVVKRDGNREDFDREKIRRGIMRAAMRTDVDQARANELAERITSMIERDARDGIRTEEIRDTLLRELDREERKIADAFRAFREGGL